MATLKQVEAATAALGMTWSRMVEVCVQDLREHGVLTAAEVERLQRPGVYRLGELVAMRGHGRYRAARVWKVSRRTQRISALYLTPCSLAESRAYAPTLCNITGSPLGLIATAGSALLDGRGGDVTSVPGLS
jgi:hypothetical protein